MFKPRVIAPTTEESAKNFLKILYAGKAVDISSQWQTVLCEALEKIVENEKRLDFQCVTESIDLVSEEDEEFLNTEGENDRLSAFHFPKGDQS